MHDLLLKGIPLLGKYNNLFELVEQETYRLFRLYLLYFAFKLT